MLMIKQIPTWRQEKKMKIQNTKKKQATGESTLITYPRIWSQTWLLLIVKQLNPKGTCRNLVLVWTLKVLCLRLSLWMDYFIFLLSFDTVVGVDCRMIMFLQISQVVKPCGRINSCMAVGRDTLYLYGGTMEIKDREITLDDLYTLNLSKLDEWKCIKSVCYIFLTQFYKISIHAIV